jgi:hypothetical protein
MIEDTPDARRKIVERLIEEMEKHSSRSRLDAR